MITVPMISKQAYGTVISQISNTLEKDPFIENPLPWVVMTLQLNDPAH